MKALGGNAGARSSQKTCSAVCVLLAFMQMSGVVVSAQSSVCPKTFPQPVITSSQVPADVSFPSGSTAAPIVFFDDYSWRAFIAMVWPADTSNGQRGVPSSTLKVGQSSSTLVFQTLKNDWEIFQPNGNPPCSNWNDYPGQSTCTVTPAPVSPCTNVQVGPNDLVLASFSKFGNLGEAGFGKLMHTLPAQNKTWVRYATVFNRIEFDQIVPNQWYLAKNLPATLAFPVGALDLKSSWIDMTNVPHPERYYTRQAWLMDPVSGACSQQTVGLVGLHIVQKTPTRPQWLWSTFEQVDTVPPAVAGSPAPPFGFNNGDGTGMPTADPNGGFPANDWSNPKIYNVTRGSNPATQQTFDINPSTAITNACYQNALANTPWQYYQLVMTQWPLQLNPPNPIPPTQTGGPANTFPGNGATSAFANSTLETWDQNSINFGCMACHTVTQKHTDFLWSLAVNAFSPSTPHAALLARAPGRQNAKLAATPVPARLKGLHDILLQAEQANQKARAAAKAKSTSGKTAPKSNTPAGKKPSTKPVPTATPPGQL